MSSFGARGRTASYSSITDALPLQRTHTTTEAEDPVRAEQIEKLWRLMEHHLSSDVTSIQRDIAKHVEYTLASSRFSFDSFKAYMATSYTIRDRLIESWNDTNAHFTALGCKRVSYLSLEFLMGRSMQNALLNMDLEENYSKALRELGFQLEELREEEKDAALGNGGLGRLAACFLDSMATLNLPAWGYGIRYNYGIFKQLIREGAQVEVPDYWLNFGNPWEIPRQDVTIPVRFYGSVRLEVDAASGKERSVWEGGEEVLAMAYDNPIPGYDTYNTINLRLWKAMPRREFDFSSFNSGDYSGAADARQRAENISAVLYPSDSTASGKELRLKQQYFFVSATLRDLMARFRAAGCPGGWTRFSEANAIQLNDTHPSIAIAELMRLLVDEEDVPWGEAWHAVQATFGYTNHTILPEALERWSVELMGHLLPRNLEVIYKINWHFLEALRCANPSSPPSDDFLGRVSLIEEGGHGGGKMVRMANLACIGSHSINGVAALHTELVKTVVFPELYSLFPERFNNKTNGVTPRRWINQANPGLAGILNRYLGGAEWLKNLDALSQLRVHAGDGELQAEWRAMKLACKARLAVVIGERTGVAVHPEALFDVQVKRIHEYKRQQLNALYCIHRYRWIKGLSAEQRAAVVPRVCIFGGKAAPGYDMAKRIIRLIHRIAARVNSDGEVGDLFKVVFLPNYNVSLAEVIVPASDISQHISTAGMEASGTSNMKFAMNGGSIIGTMDGANIEIAEECDRENLFIFGALTREVAGLREERRTRPPREYSPALRAVLSDIAGGLYGHPDDVAPLLSTFKWENDFYLVTHDFDDYCRAQSLVDKCYMDKGEWTRRSILCAAGMGKFSTDRTIDEYAKDIWNIKAAPRAAPVTDAMGRSRSFPSLEGLSSASSVGAPVVGGGAGGGARRL